MLNFTFGNSDEKAKEQHLEKDVFLRLQGVFKGSEFDEDEKILVLSKEPRLTIDYYGCKTEQDCVFKMIEIANHLVPKSAKNYIAKGVCEFLQYNNEVLNLSFDAKIAVLTSFACKKYEVEEGEYQIEYAIAVANEYDKCGYNEHLISYLNEILGSNFSSTKDIEQFLKFFNNEVPQEEKDYYYQKMNSFLETKDVSVLAENKKNFALVGMNFYKKTCAEFVKNIYDFDENKEKMKLLLSKIQSIQNVEEWIDSNYFDVFLQMAKNSDNELYEEIFYSDDKPCSVEVGCICLNNYNNENKLASSLLDCRLFVSSYAKDTVDSLIKEIGLENEIEEDEIETLREI